MLLKQFPSLLGARHLDDLTPEQEHWLLVHMLAEQGVAPCPQCEELGSSRYCEACGTARHPAAPVHRCPTCQAEGRGTYCGSCGAALVHPVTQDLDAGTFDWDAWEHELEPFMGGLSKADQQYLDGDFPLGAF